MSTPDSPSLPERSPPSRDGNILLYLPWEFDMLGGVDVVVDRLWKGLEKSIPGRAIIGIQDWHFQGEKTDAEGRRFLHLNLPAPPSANGLAAWRYRITLAKRIPQLLRTLKHYQITTVNVHFPTINSYVLALLKRYALWKGRLVLSFHGSDADQLCTESQHWKIIAEQTDEITTCSLDLAQRIENIGLFNKPIQVIYNGIDCDSFTKGKYISVLPFSGEYILNVGSFVPHKGQDLLISAFSRIAKARPQLKLLFIGASLNRKWLNTLKDQSIKLNLQNNVYFLENQPQENIAYFMQNALCLTQTSHREGFSLVLIEAAACNTPIITTYVGGIPEIIPSNDFAITIKSREKSALEEAILTIINHPRDAKIRAENLKKRVTNLFSTKTMTEHYINTITNNSPQKH